MNTVDSERGLLARTRWVVTAQLAIAITVVVVLVGGTAWCVMDTGQRTDAGRELRHVAAHGNVASPPPCDWVFLYSDGALRRTERAPAALPVWPAIRQVAADHRTRVSRERVGGISYLVRTQPRGDGVIQVALDLRYQTAERRRLALALAAAELAGLLAALVTGGVLARRAISPLGEALAKQRRFVADASHELRTPLTQLHTRAQLLERRARTAADPDAVLTELGRLVAGTRQLGEVVEDLLLSAQLRQTRPADGDADPVDLAALVDAVAADEADRAGSLGVTVSVYREPPAPHGYRVAGVEAALRRVVTALLDNALGHTPAGGRIDLTLRYSGRLDRRRTVQLTVADSGVGFDQKEADRVFERFARGSNGAGRRFGIGLALVREVVEGHGGTITAAGRPGAGASFTVTLPAATPATDGQPAGRRAVLSRL
ncbi:MAG: sensor histidine kinase [Mycobacteriales bacterium]